MLHTIDSRSSRCSDEDMTTGSQSGVDLPFQRRKLHSPHTSRLASEQKTQVDIIRWFFSSFFSFSHLSHLKNGTCRDIFSLTQLKQRQTTGQYLSTKHTARFFLFPTPEGQWGSRSLAPFRLRTAGLAFSRVGFANQNSTASAELSRFLGERNGRKPRRITAFWPSDVTRDVISVTKPNSGEFLSESGNRIL